MEYRQISPHLLLRNLLLRASKPLQFVPVGFEYRIEPATAAYLKEDLANHGTFKAQVVVLGETGREQASAFSVDGHSYFLLTDTRLTQYDAKTGEQLKVIPVLGASTLSISPGGRYVAVGTPSELLLVSQSNLDVVAKVPTVTGNPSRG